MLKFITQKKEWDRIVNCFNEKDFYHSYDYHQACLKDKETAILLVYKKEATLIAFPILVRPINGSGYYDAASVYGYAGPLVDGLRPDFNFDHYKSELITYFSEHRIVSIFSSINPFIHHQMELLSPIGTIESLGNIVYFDLENSDTHVQQYSKTTKRYVKRNKRLFEVREGRSEQDARQFLNIYYNNMDRLRADAQYYFKLPYFLDLLNSNCCDAYFVFAIYKETGEVASAAFMVATNHIIQYHLSGTLDAYRHFSPVRSIIDYTREKGVAEKYSFFNLGGGVGSKNDSLYEFKASFSKNKVPFKVWKFIADKKAYDQLCSEYPPIQELDKPNYFPKYRSGLGNT